MKGEIYKRDIKERKKTKFFFGLFLFFLLIGSLIYLVIFSPVFKIKNIVIFDNKEVDDNLIKRIIEEKLNQAKFKIIPQDSFFSIWSKALEDEILDNFKEIEIIKIRKKIFEKTLEIEIQERKKEAILCYLPETQECFFISQEGIILKEAPLIKGGPFPLIETEKDKLSEIGPATIKFINKFKRELEKNTAVSVFSFIFKNSREIILKTPQDWQAYLSLQESPVKQAEILKRILQEEIKEKQNNLEYIDLRIEGRVYYKYK